jgi:hypothetical protein
LALEGAFLTEEKRNSRIYFSYTYSSLWGALGDSTYIAIGRGFLAGSSVFWESGFLFSSFSSSDWQENCGKVMDLLVNLKNFIEFQK